MSDASGNRDCPEYFADDELNLDAVQNGRRHDFNPLVGNPPLNSGAFVHFGDSQDATETSRLRPIVNPSTERNEMGSVEREFRHVRSESEDTAFHPKTKNMDPRSPRVSNYLQQTNVNNFDLGSQNAVPRLIRVVVGEPNTNEQIIDKEIFVTEQRYREMVGGKGDGFRNIQNNS